jgi:glycosyltransferase involved in cell wall biosynthesis
MESILTNVVFIAFEFPPLNRGGVFRPLAFVEHLPKFGIRPIVITLDPNSFSSTFESYSSDDSLGKEVLDNTIIYRIKANIPTKNKSKISNFISIYFSMHGNETKYWHKNFRSKIVEIISIHSPKAIMATVPPFGILPLALEIAQKYNLPLIYDFRDAWSQWRTIPYGSILHYWYTLILERKYLKKANIVIATSEQTLSDFKTLHPRINSKKLSYIPNGYNGNLEKFSVGTNQNEQFTIGYVGSFYYDPIAREQMLMPWWKKRLHRKFQYTPIKQDWLYRSPYFFFRTLKKLNEESPEISHKIKVKFAGKKPDWLSTQIKEFGLEDQVELIGEITHQQSLDFQKKCDALLITSAKQLNGVDYSIAGKTFEYIQIQRPILAFVCEGAQKDLLQKTGTSTIFNPDNLSESVKQLRAAINGQIEYSPNLEFIQSLSRVSLSEKLANDIKNTIYKA